MEYFYYKNILLACRYLFKPGCAQRGNVETLKNYLWFNIQSKFYIRQRDIFSAVPKTKLVPNTRREYVMGDLLQMQEIKNSPEFLTMFQQYVNFLLDSVKYSSPAYMPAETVLSDAEICFLLCVRPDDVLPKIKTQSPEMQKVLVKRGLSRRVRNTPKSVGVAYQKDCLQEILDVISGQMDIKDMKHISEIPNTIKDNRFNWLVEDKSSRLILLDKIESAGPAIVPVSVLEQIRLALIYSEERFESYISGFFIGHMKNPPKNIKEASVKHNPYSISAIKFQYDAIQELSLRVCADAGRYKSLTQVYKLLKNPSVKITKLYKKLFDEYYNTLREQCNESLDR